MNLKEYKSFVLVLKQYLQHKIKKQVKSIFIFKIILFSVFFYIIKAKFIKTH